MTRRNQLLSRSTAIVSEMDALRVQLVNARPGSPQAISLADKIRRLRVERAKLRRSLEVER